ncbi:MAG TPA: hypothetical protein VGJ16_02810, partial [Pirellulales bacterium]
ANRKSAIQDRKSLRPPQFGLRTLLLLVTACGVLLALRQWFSLSPIAIAALLLFALSIFFHVAGNVIGTRLRSIGDEADARETETLAATRRLEPRDFAPVTHLSQRHNLGITIVVVVSVGAVLGGAGGGIWTWLASPGHVGLSNVAVGVVAFGILGALAAFGTVAFAQVMLGAMWQAMNSPQKTPSAASETEQSGRIMRAEGWPPLSER